MTITETFNLYREPVTKTGRLPMLRGLIKTVLKVLFIIVVAVVLGWPVLQLMKKPVTIPGQYDIPKQFNSDKLEAKLNELSKISKSGVHCPCTTPDMKFRDIAELSFEQDNIVDYVDFGMKALAHAKNPTGSKYHHLDPSASAHIADMIIRCPYYIHFKKLLPAVHSIMSASLDSVRALKEDYLSGSFSTLEYKRTSMLNEISHKTEQRFARSGRATASGVLKNMLAFETALKPSTLRWHPFDDADNDDDGYGYGHYPPRRRRHQVTSTTAARCAESWPSILEIKQLENASHWSRSGSALYPTALVDEAWKQGKATGDDLYDIGCSFYDIIMAYDEFQVYNLVTYSLACGAHEYQEFATSNSSNLPPPQKTSSSTLYNSSMHAFVKNISMSIDPNLYYENCNPELCTYSEYRAKTMQESMEVLFAVLGGVPTMATALMIPVGLLVNFILKDNNVDEIDSEETDDIEQPWNELAEE